MRPALRDYKPHPAVAATVGDWMAWEIDRPRTVSTDIDIVLHAVVQGLMVEAAKQGMMALRVRHLCVQPRRWSVGSVLPTLETRLCETTPERLPGLEALDHAMKAYPEGEVRRAIYSEAVRLLDIIQSASIGTPAPNVGVGEDEISISWEDNDHTVLLSVEGDGEASYAYRVDGRFRPGQEAFALSRKHLPDDLREYLESMYA